MAINSASLNFHDILQNSFDGIWLRIDLSSVGNFKSKRVNQVPSSHALFPSFLCEHKKIIWL